MALDEIEKYLNIVFQISGLLTVILAVYKFKLFEVFKHRYSTEMLVKSKYTKSGKLYVVCTYVIHNTGEIPIRIDEVNLSFYKAEEKDQQIKCAEETVLLNRVFRADNPRYSELMKISAGSMRNSQYEGFLKSQVKPCLFMAILAGNIIAMLPHITILF